MTAAFAGETLAYTVRAEEREGLLDAIEGLDPHTFEVILFPVGDAAKFTIRTETVPGAVQAINDMAPEFSSAIVRVYEVTA